MNIDLSGLGNAVMALATIAIAIATWRGVNTWRTQLRTTAATKSLALVFRLRDAVRSARSPAGLSSEAEGFKPPQGLAPDVVEVRKQHYVYHRRLQEVVAVERELKVAEYEAFAAIGRERLTSLQDIHKLLDGLWAAFMTYFQAREQYVSVGDNSWRRDESISDMYRTLYGTAGKEDDFFKKFEAAVAKAEEQLRKS